MVISRSPIVIKSKKSLEQAINVIASQGFLPLYCGLVVSEVKYLRVYYPTKDRYGKPKETLGDKILEVVKEYPTALGLNRIDKYSRICYTYFIKENKVVVYVKRFESG